MSEFPYQPALPVIERDAAGQSRQWFGLTIRQQAVLLMAAALAAEEGYGNKDWPHNLATDACKLADAVLKAERETR